MPFLRVPVWWMTWRRAYFVSGRRSYIFEDEYYMSLGYKCYVYNIIYTSSGIERDRRNNTVRNGVADFMYIYIILRVWVLVAERVRPHRLEVKSGSWGRSPLLQRQGPKTPSFRIPGKTLHGIWANLLHFVETMIITSTPIYIYIYLSIYPLRPLLVTIYVRTAEWAAVSSYAVCGVGCNVTTGKNHRTAHVAWKLLFDPSASP